MSVELDGQPRLGAVSLTLEGQTLFATDQKLVYIIVEKRHTCDCYRAGLAVLEVKTLLKYREREREREKKRDRVKINFV